MKTYYPFWLTKAIITPIKEEVSKKKGRIDLVDYAINVIKLEDFNVIMVIAEPNEDLIPPKDYLKKTFSLEEFEKLKNVMNTLMKELNIGEIVGEVTFYTITPEKELFLEKIDLLGVADLIYGKIEDGKIKAAAYPGRALTKDLPKEIIITLPSKGDVMQMVETAYNIQWALSLARVYSAKLLARYDDYLKINEIVNEMVDETFQKMKEVGIKEIDINTLNELGALAKKLVEIEKAATYDLSNVQANYRNLENILRTIGMLEMSAEGILGKQILEAWETILEKIRAISEGLSTAYQIIRSKMQLESIKKQSDIMELSEKSGKYLNYIQVFTGVLVFAQILQAFLKGDYITTITVFVLTMIILYLMGREKKR